MFLRLTSSRHTFKQSTFNLGKLSVPLTCVAVTWLFVTSIFFMLPTAFDEQGNQNAEIFNYTPVVVAAVLIISAIYWYLPQPYGARHFFKGPKRESILKPGVYTEIEGQPAAKYNYEEVK